MDRILIIGLQAAGKSTFANKLGKELNKGVIHLDKLYYRPGWVAVSKVEWQNTLQEIIAKKQWIIDGNYHSSLDARLQPADTVIFFNFPRWICIYRALRRSFQKEQPFDKAAGNYEKVSWGLIKKILTYPRKEILIKLEQSRHIKDIFIISSSNEADNLLNKLTGNN